MRHLRAEECEGGSHGGVLRSRANAHASCDTPVFSLSSRSHVCPPPLKPPPLSIIPKLSPERTRTGSRIELTDPC
eukprot:6197200-Pleurochrysis_carterae.AAC.2